MSTDKPLSNKQVKALLHDISGPIATSRGIQSELEESVKILAEEIIALDAQIPHAVSMRLRSLLSEDIEPCLEHLGASMATLNGRVKDFANTHASASD